MFDIDFIGDALSDNMDTGSVDMDNPFSTNIDYSSYTYSDSPYVEMSDNVNFNNNYDYNDMSSQMNNHNISFGHSIDGLENYSQTYDFGDAISEFGNNTVDFLHSHLPNPVRNMVDMGVDVFDAVRHIATHSYDAIEDVYNKLTNHTHSNLESSQIQSTDLITERPMTLDENTKLDLEIAKYRRSTMLLESRMALNELNQAALDDASINGNLNYLGLPELPIYEDALDHYNKEHSIDAMWNKYKTW